MSVYAHKHCFEAAAAAAAAEEEEKKSNSRNSSSKSSTRSIIQKIIDLWSCTMSVTEAISRVDKYYGQRKYYDHDNDDNIIDKDNNEGLKEEYNAEEGSKIRKRNFHVFFSFNVLLLILFQSLLLHQTRWRFVFLHNFDDLFERNGHVPGV